jgi:putative protease
MPEVEVGTVIDFFAKVMAAGVSLSDRLSVGDRVHIKGHTTDLEMVVSSMQVNNVDVKEGKAGDDVGIKVPDRVRRGDKVYKVTD